MQKSCQDTTQVRDKELGLPERSRGHPCTATHKLAQRPSHSLLLGNQKRAQQQHEPVSIDRLVHQDTPRVPYDCTELRGIYKKIAMQVVQLLLVRDFRRHGSRKPNRDESELLVYHMFKNLPGYVGFEMGHELHHDIRLESLEVTGIVGGYEQVFHIP